MAVTCFGMMAGDAIAQERGGREQGEGAQRRQRPSGAAGEQHRERGQGAERRQRPSGAGRERGSRGSQFGGQGGPGGFLRMFPVMAALDSDGNGEISSEEIKDAVAVLKKLDKNKDGKLSNDELMPNFGGRGGFGGRSSSQGGSRQMTDGAAVGDITPDFTLKILGSDNTLKLSEQYAKKPVVLTLGSYTCPPYRKALEGIEKLYKEQKDDCIFLFVYIKEAHASDGRVSIVNESRNIDILQHTTLGERSTAAKFCQGKLNITMPILIDTMDNATEKLFAGRPNRTYLINKDGKIIYKGPRGPQGTQPDAVKKAIADLLSK
jgi:peroxiredoxin